MENSYYTVERNVQIVLSLLKSYGIHKVIASPGTTNVTLVASMQSDPWFEMYSSIDERSAAYMARYIAKNLVAAGLCRKCQIELAYAIGVAHPVSVLVDTYGTGVLSEEKLSAIVNECFDMRPARIIEKLDLRRPIYEQTAAYGHFGRTDIDLPWEHLDMVEKLKSYL